MSRFIWFFVVCAGGLLAGCQQKMAKQPSHRPFEPSNFFADGQSARPQVFGTVAHGHLRTDVHLFTGKQMSNPDTVRAAALVAIGAAKALAVLAVAMADIEYVDTFPFPITHEVMQRGRERYQIYCALCHDERGTGRGKIVERGYTRPPSYHIDRLRVAPVGYFFDIITRGYGSMPDYASQVSAEDRWAIIAYIRALQLSQQLASRTYGRHDLPRTDISAGLPGRTRMSVLQSGELAAKAVQP